MRCDEISKGGVAMALPADLCGELIALLQEAGSRGSAYDAGQVIFGTLSYLSDAHPEVKPLVQAWRGLVNCK